MKQLITLLFLCYSIIIFSQEGNKNWRTISSLTDWVEEVNSWPDSIYEVENIRILFDSKKDAALFADMNFRRDTIIEDIATVVTKDIIINGLDFGNSDFGIGGKAKLIKNIHFKGSVRITNYVSFPVIGFTFKNMIFDKRFALLGPNKFGYFNFIDCKFNSSLAFFDFKESAFFSFHSVHLTEYIQFTRCLGKPYIHISNSDFNWIHINNESITEIDIRSSIINNLSIKNSFIGSKLHLVENEIKLFELSGAQIPESNTYIPFEQVSGNLFVKPQSNTRLDAIEYVVSDTMDFGLKEDYDLLISSYKSLLSSYQKRGDQDSYNNCYTEMKDIETRRLAYFHKKDPSFRSYFTWKINQFLKVFSAYGTEPARGIIFSLYVILFFALIYLLFPNSWDSHGKKRLMHRFDFFQKYLRRKEGMHTLYLEDKQHEISSYNDFKTNLEDAHLELPAFFISWSKPLYHASMFSSRIMSRLLKTTDVLEGKWKELTPKQKRWKNIQVGFLLTLGLFYDLFIKILNALMLSINTFTTLGFGEIPIKGLPRYLAIIQGFIGWFMLTIFSVSLISQMLN